jgi:small subunit ribosomal protein S15
MMRFVEKSMLNKDKKAKIIKKFRTHESDTGSPQVQIAILTEEVKELTGHLKTHRKDFSSRRGLLKKVAERRRLLKYLEREDAKAYAELIEALGLKK